MTERERIHAKYDGRCAYCGDEITVKQMHVDHIEPMRRGDPGDKTHLDVFENKNPSCRSCNYYKSTYSLEQFRERMDLMIQNLLRQSTVKVLLRYDKVQFTTGPVKFYYESERSDDY